jgi:hypothetical protein
MRPALLFLLLLCLLQSKGQKKLLEIPLTPSLAGTLAMASLQEEKNQLLLTFVQQQEINRHLVDGRGNTRTLTSVKAPGEELVKLYRKSAYEAGAFTETAIIDLLRDRQTGNYFFVETATTGESRVTDTLSSRLRLRKIHHYLHQDTLLVLMQDMKSARLAVYAKYPGEKLRVFSLEGEEANKDRMSPERRMQLFYRVRGGTATYPDNLWLPPTYQQRGRVHVEGPKLSVLLNDKGNESLIFGVDLVRKSTRMTRFPLSPLTGSPRYSQASWKNGDLLVVATALTDTLLLRFFDTETGGLLGEQRLTENNFNLYSPAVVKQGSFWSGNKTEEISFSVFLRKCLANQLQLTGYRNGQLLFITFSTPYQLVPAADLGGLLTLETLVNAETRPAAHVSFSSCFSLPGLSPLMRPFNYRQWDNILHYLFAGRSNPNAVSMDVMDGVILIGTIREDRSRFQLYQFGRGTED